MLFRFEMHLAQGYLLIHAEGEFTAAGMGEALVELWARPDHNPDLHLLVDFRNGSLAGLSAAELDGLLGHAIAVASGPRKGNLAVVTGTDVDFGMMRQTEAYRDLRKQDMAEGVAWGAMRVFRDLPAARRWLAVDSAG